MRFIYMVQKAVYQCTSKKIALKVMSLYVFMAKICLQILIGPRAATTSSALVGLIVRISGGLVDLLIEGFF